LKHTIRRTLADLTFTALAVAILLGIGFSTSLTGRSKFDLAPFGAVSVEATPHFSSLGLRLFHLSGCAFLPQFALGTIREGSHYLLFPKANEEDEIHIAIQFAYQRALFLDYTNHHQMSNPAIL
jgi:hypothetical protein